MAVVTFWGETSKEIGQTYSIATIATNIAANHNQRILVISIDANDTTLENCFWDPKKTNQQKQLLGIDKKVNVDSGVEGLAKAVSTGRATPENISNYTKVVFEGRLEVLKGYQGKNAEMYNKIRAYYPEIIKIANRHYDLVLVDLGKGYTKFAKAILESSDLILFGISQTMSTIETYAGIKKQNLLRTKR